MKSVISLSTKLIAAHDPHDFCPLCMGKTEDGKSVFSSALDRVGQDLCVIVAR